MTLDERGELLREAAELRVANGDLREWIGDATRLLAEVREHLPPSPLRDRVVAVVGTLGEVAAGNGRLEGLLRYFTCHEVALGCFTDRMVAVAYARAQGGASIEIIGPDRVVQNVELCESCDEPIFDDAAEWTEDPVALCPSCADELRKEPQEAEAAEDLS